MKCRFFSLEAILRIVVSFLFCSVSASAQSYIGGSFRFSANSSGSNASTTPSNGGLSINVAPDLGWFIGDRWAVGVRPWIGFSHATASNGNQARSFILGVTPYARYQVLGYRRFGLWAEADPELSFTQNRTSFRESGLVSKSLFTRYGVEFVPVLTYQLNRRISLESRLNLVSLALMGSRSVYSDGQVNYSFSGGLSATTQDLLGTLSDITIGFLYKF